MTDMQYRIKELAKQCGAVSDFLALGRHDGILFSTLELERFAQAIARECAEICMARSLRPMPADEGWTENEWDLIQCACELDAVEIEQRFGLATPPGDNIKRD